MKVAVSETKKPILKYPKLMRSKMGTIVLMTNHGTGTVLCDGVNVARTGEVSSDWNMDSFEDFDGTVALSNK